MSETKVEGKSANARRSLDEVLAQIDKMYDEHKSDPDAESLSKPVEL